MKKQLTKGRKMRSMLALLLCLILTAGMLAGCGGKPQESTSGAEKESSAEAATEKESTAGTESADTGVEYIGEGLPLVAPGEEATLTVGIRQNLGVENYETNEYTLWVEEQTGVNLEFVYFSSDPSEAATQLALMISGGEKLPDIYYDIGNMTLSLTSLFEYGEDGYFVDLLPYFETDSNFFAKSAANLTEEQYNNMMSLGKDPTTGALYAWPHFEPGGGLDSCASCVMINSEWLKKVGAEMPTTIDELKDVLIKFRDEDPNGNGKADEIPLIGSYVYRGDLIPFLINAFVYCNDTYFFNATDGKVWAPYTTDEYRQALIYLNEMFDEGLISPLTFTQTEGDGSVIGPICSPEDGVALAGVIGAHTSIYSDPELVTMYEYMGLAPLGAKTDKGGYASMMADTCDYGTVITKDCEDPELAFKLLDFMGGFDSVVFQRYGVEGRDWERAAEGLTTSRGTPAYMNVLDSSLWASPNNVHWHMVNSIVNYGMMGSALIDDGSFNAKKNLLSLDVLTKYKAAPVPEERVFDLVYTADEQEVVSDVKELLTDYIQEQRGLFITGVLDPNDDKAWQEYVDACESQGLSRYQEVTQAAYDRLKQ